VDLVNTFRWVGRSAQSWKTFVYNWNLTDHPQSEWTIQQFRNSLPLEGSYRFVIHDRDGIFA